MKSVKQLGFYPVQCKCGHLFLEKYQFPLALENGDIGFCYCGFCQNKVMVKYRAEAQDAPVIYK